MDKKTIEELISRAVKARKNAYMPYSNYAVGAAVLWKTLPIRQECVQREML